MILRRIRRLVGLALLGWSAWTLLRVLVRPAEPRPLYGVDDGRDTGLRIGPLTPWEAARARALERDELLKPWPAPVYPATPAPLAWWLSQGPG